MSAINAVQAGPAADGTSVTISTVDGSPLTEHLGPHGILEVAEGSWGLTAAGQPYFDTAGASLGELAVLGYDVQSGHYFVESATDPWLAAA